jgi:hypothetical protein
VKFLPWGLTAWVLVSPSLALAQQESPLTSNMIEKAKAKQPPPSEATQKLGAEFRDNPDWLDEEQRLAAEAEAKAQAEKEDAAKAETSYLAGYRTSNGIGLSPLHPGHQSVVPGGVTPPMGAPVAGSDFRFDFHGYLQAGLRAGIGSRDEALAGQQQTTMHADPVVPGASFGWFDHTNTVPVPWTQLNFEFGNDVVRATAVLGAWSHSEADDAAGYFQPPSKLGFSDAYLTYTPHLDPVGLRVVTGVYSESYGAMAEYHNGAYGTSLIAAIYGVGASSTLTLPFENEVTTTIEGGFKGDFNRAPPELVLDQSNEFAPAIEGSTYAAHGPLAFDFDTLVEVTGHGIYTFSQDDRGDELAGRELYLGDGERLDGSMLIFGLDARFRLKEWGHLYVGGSQVIGENTLTLSNLVQVLNNGPGRDMTRRYFTYSSGGNGKLTFVGGQYDLSLGTLLRHPVEFYGEGPDLKVSLFGIYGQQENDGDLLPQSDMLKFGTELTYSPFKWMALAGRFDSVMPQLDDSSQNFAVITPKLVFRNDWSNQATLTMQYSGYIMGENVIAKGDERVLNNPNEEPDAHLLALYGTIWW